MNPIKELRADGSDPLFDKTNMLYKEFPSDFRQIRYFTLLIVQSAPLEIKEINLLEQQISEIIKNAVKHGNDCDLNKKVRIWYSFSSTHAHLIVEDEGSGFKDLEKWNDFNRKRLECLYNQDFEHLGSYVSFRTTRSDEQDGGNVPSIRKIAQRPAAREQNEAFFRFWQFDDLQVDSFHCRRLFEASPV